MKDISKNLTKASPDYAKLLNFVAGQPAGTELDYMGVTKSTGVKMDEKGRRLLYRAIIACGKRALLKRNIGYVLSDPENAGEIAFESATRAFGGIVRTNVTARILQDEHGDELPAATKQYLHLQLIVTQEIVSTVKRKKLITPPAKQISSSNPVLPEGI